MLPLILAQFNSQSDKQQIPAQSQAQYLQQKQDQLYSRSLRKQIRRAKEAQAAKEQKMSATEEKTGSVMKVIPETEILSNGSNSI